MAGTMYVTVAPVFEAGCVVPNKYRIRANLGNLNKVHVTPLGLDAARSFGSSLADAVRNEGVNDEAINSTV